MDSPAADEEEPQTVVDDGGIPDGDGDGEDDVEGTTAPLPVYEASKEALTFIESLCTADFSGLLFTDSLVTVSDAGKELGEFSVTMEEAYKDGEECFLIHANSHGSIDHVPCGTSITAYVSKTLQTIEQHHHEYVKVENHPLDRKTFITQQDDNYIVNRIITQGEDIQRLTLTYTKQQMKGFITEGANLLLQRLLIHKEMPANFEFISFDAFCQICKAVYKPLDEREQSVGDDIVTVYGIERTLESTMDLPATWQSYYLSDSHLVLRVQVGSPVNMRLIKLPAKPLQEDLPEKPSFPKQPLNWEEDMEMYSKFLQRKEALKDDHMTYMRHHPELRALLADFLQFLMIRKPGDVLGFASDYFSSFSPNHPSVRPYTNLDEFRKDQIQVHLDQK